MQFQIPQFIETEDKIVGPLTMKQFLWIAAAAGVSFALFFILQFALWLLATILVAAVALAAAFGKYQSRPLPIVVWHWFKYFWKPKVYIWQREPAFREVEIKGRRFELPLEMPSVKKLWQDLLTSKTPIPKREKSIGTTVLPKVKERYNVFRKITGEKEIARRVDYR